MPIKVISLNLFEGGIFWDTIVAFFDREVADIYCLQEANDGSADQPDTFRTVEKLKALFPDFHVYYSPELFQIWPEGGVDTGNIILSKFPIVTSETIFLHQQYAKIVRPADEKDFTHYPKNLQHVVVSVGSSELHLFNLHGVWGFDGDDSVERLEMSRLITAAIKDTAPAVLMGDFNVQPNTETIAQIERHFTNVFKDQLTTTFNMKHKTNPGYATAVVDMFFASPDVEIVTARCPDDDVSDHKPLVVEINHYTFGKSMP